ncbi:MAG: hypothetical protein P8H59_10120 [Flavobacteriales bacterium]|nr:hypothetical protein [Flavobacteriales bacterium]MDG1781297.1 hypothetical protein [Flavobacteriales bacterium]
MEMTFAFYNVENLFDTSDDPNKKDTAFTPNGELKWDERKYHRKIESIATVIEGMSHGGVLPAFIGFCEVENQKVLEELVKHPKLNREGYEIIHVESRDVRGIDVALAFSPSVFEVKSYKMHNFEERTGTVFFARDIMQVTGTIPNGETLHVFINHWSSRRAGPKETEYKRVAAARTLREQIDEIRDMDPEAKILIIGDFNDGPNNKSLKKVLNAGRVDQNSDLVNLSWPLFKKGYGTCKHEHKWYFFDQIIVSKTLLQPHGVNVRKDKMYIYQEGEVLFKHKGGKSTTPNRTFVGGEYKGGVSDHLPVYVRLKLSDLKE